MVVHMARAVRIIDSIGFGYHLFGNFTHHFSLIMMIWDA